MYAENENTLDGFVEAVIFRNDENGYSVLDISVDGKLFTAVGTFSSVSIGDHMILKGYWSNHPSFGRQFKVTESKTSLPETAAEMLKYLSSKTIKGIGPATAAKIVDRFGDETFDVIENRPHLLTKINGITESKAKRISDEFKNQAAVREIMIYLEKYGMRPSECLAAYKVFGANAINIISENPYILCRQHIGIGFERADEIAGTFFDKKNTVYRERAGVVHVISHNLENGHTCLPREKVVPLASELLDITQDITQKIIDDLVKDKELMQHDLDGKPFLFLPEMYTAERNIAKRIQVMLKFPPASGRPIEEDIDEIEEKNSIHFEQNQRLAIMTAVKKGLLVLTGGPGTGKTTTLNGILELYEKRDLRVLLAAPTGRAAKRMSEVTGRPAKTIHRLLEVVWGENNRQMFSRNMENPLEADAVIVDELSMVDVNLFWSLLDALPLGCRLCLVGDSDQLPAVGAGNVLHDIIESGLLPTVKLTQVFRQAMESLIVTNAHRIVGGEMPELGCTDKDFFFLKRNTISSAAATVVELYTKRLPKAYGYDSIRDIQIICPSRKGELGTVSLNAAMQNLLNPAAPDKDEFVSGGRIFRTGDKVMQIKNNYEILWTKGLESSSGIFNGDMGTILSISKENGTMKIKFDDRLAFYPFENASELEHAYAVTVHKSQGCEFEAVIMPVCAVVPQLSYRNLLYTAVTRAKNMLVLVGTKNQIKKMVDNDKRIKRYSALKYFLLEDD